MLAVKQALRRELEAAPLPGHQLLQALVLLGLALQSPRHQAVPRTQRLLVLLHSCQLPALACVHLHQHLRLLLLATHGLLESVPLVGTVRQAALQVPAGLLQCVKQLFILLPPARIVQRPELLLLQFVR
jgi:hypothetical protein